MKNEHINILKRTTRNPSSLSLYSLLQMTKKEQVLLALNPCAIPYSCAHKLKHCSTGWMPSSKGNRSPTSTMEGDVDSESTCPYRAKVMMWWLSCCIEWLIHRWLVTHLTFNIWCTYCFVCIRYFAINKFAKDQTQNLWTILLGNYQNKLLVVSLIHKS